ncbi:hypothetical protein [Curtobacterium sp. MCBD17_040]|nr:hypothetical protein [Curtobacterium sp. MCBD17_040]WIB65746.1 hypothetical protein DEI94_16640 [Curtobacterium sp. MCBD17_040]
MHAVITIVLVLALSSVFALTSWMRSKNGPLKKYRRDYRQEHDSNSR